MKRIVCLMLICLCYITGCNNAEEVKYKTISSNEAYDMITNREDIIILDVRSEFEYKESHIEKAINVPLDELEKSFESLVTNNKESTILVYCASGSRSKEASKLLASLGYVNVYDFGGLSTWGYDLVSEEE